MLRNLVRCSTLVIALMVLCLTGMQSRSVAQSKVWAWGSGISTPVQVSGLPEIKAVACGSYNHSLALAADGTVWAWGDNLFGKLGDGTNISRATPVQVVGLTDIVAISAGWYDSMALRSDGTVWAWGYGRNGELGDGNGADSYVPVRVSGLTNVTAISCGYFHNLAVTADGAAWAWGANDFGTLGDGTTLYRYIPVQVSGLTGITAIGGGENHSLALRSDGTVWAWGQGFGGQLGNGANLPSLTPVQTVGLTHVTSISAGGLHNLALQDGAVWAWGSNNVGQLGFGINSDRWTPVKVANLANVTSVAAGISHSLALQGDGTLWAWGFNYDGELGDGTTYFASEGPVQSLLTGVNVIAVGGGHNLAITGLQTQISDQTPPTITLTAPVDGGVYLLNQVVIADYSCTDDESGVASCVGTVPSGTPIDTSSVGAHTFTVTAMDNAGNTASVPVTYAVGYKINPLYDQTRAVRKGACYPVKLQLTDANGVNYSSAGISVHAISVTLATSNAPGTLDSVGNANPDNDFRYDASLGGYIFNLSTTSLSTGTWNLSFRAGLDSTIHNVQFQVK